MKMNLRNNMGATKEVKVGFSWTNLMFGVFTPIFRLDWKWALIQLVVGIVTSGISLLIFPFIYNKLYIKDLLKKGYRPATEEGENYLKERGFSWEE